MVLGTYSRQDRLYDAGYSVVGHGDLAALLRDAIARLPACAATQAADSPKGEGAAAPFTPPPPLPHIAEGSFFIGEDRVIRQMVDGQAESVTYGGTLLKEGGTMTGRRLAALVGLRDHARRVLQSQNEGWPEAHRNEARKALNRAYDRFVAAYGAINKTTFSETSDGTVIRRMPNLVKFREDPDAMLVMSPGGLRRGDRQGRQGGHHGQGRRRPHPGGHRRRLRRGGAARFARPQGRGGPALHRHALRQARGPDHPGTGRPHLPRPGERGTGRPPTPTSPATCGRSSPPRRTAGPAYARNAVALRPSSPRTCCPATSTPIWARRGYRSTTSRRLPPTSSASPPSAIRIGHLKKDAVWTVDADATAERSVAATSEVGTPRANGVWLLEQALNLKIPVIYDTFQGADREERVVNQEATLAAREKQKTDQGAVPRSGSSPIRSAPSGWCGSITTPTTISARASSTARTSNSPA